MSNTFTCTITKEISYNDLWDALWGSDGTGSPWCSKIRKPDGSDIDLWVKGEGEHSLVANPQDMKVYDRYEEKWHIVTLDQLADAYRKIAEQKVMHCGTYEVANLEDPDACTGDFILQYAVFGELVYG